ncbi:MAG: hypothetical protein ACTSQ8_25790 [Candidatus Helarchaeota archaeon]
MSTFNALDFVLSTLRDHEFALDVLIERLEQSLKTLSETLEKINSSMCMLARATFSCEEWNEFKDVCTGAQIVFYNLSGELKIRAVKDNIIYEFKEPIQSRIEKLRCGVPASFQANINPQELKDFLSRELNIPKEKVIRGTVKFPNIT